VLLQTIARRTGRIRVTGGHARLDTASVDINVRKPLLL
jgi:hypothetical protein